MPAIWAGYMGDDYIHHALLSANSPIVKPPDLSVFGLFSFINGDPERNRLLMDYSLIPWWTYAELKYAFWRPLSEMSHWLDHVLWPDSPWMMHLHNIAWYLLVLVLVSRLYRTTLSAPLAGVLALAVYALDSSHGFAVSWIANRNALIALSFALVSLLLYMRWRREQGRRWLFVSLIALVLSLLSAESAISVFGYMGAYALFLDKRGPLKGVFATLPHFAVIVAWWVIYKTSGFGAANADSYYVDPVNHPITFLGKLIERLPVLLASQWGFIPAELYGFSGQTIIGYVVGCLVVLLLLLIPVMRALSRTRTSMFWFCGMLFSILPVLTALPHDRLLFFTGIGASALVGNFFYHIYSLKHCNGAGLFNRYSRGTAHVLLAFHLVLAPLLLPLMTYSTKVWASLIPHQPSYFSGIKDIESKRIVLFSPPIASAMVIGPLRFYRGEVMPDRLWTITTLNDGLSFSKPDDSTLQIARAEGFLQGQAEEAFRNFQEQPLVEGESVTLSGLKIVMKDLNNEGKPTRLLLHFDRPLSDESLLFLKWDNEENRYQKLNINSAYEAD